MNATSVRRRHPRPDPDGLEFEIAWVVPADRLDDDARSHKGVLPLDLPREKQRYGATTRGGVGISIPAGL